MSASDVIAVAGGGTMGAGIAALACRSGIDAALCEVDAAALDAAVARVEGELDRLVRRGRISDPEARAAREGLRPSIGLDGASGAALAIEAVPEELDLKRKVLAGLERVAPRAVLASNTSSIPIASLARAVKEPERLLGLHFFNPPGAMRLVELVRAPRTAPGAVGAARRLAEALGKLVVEVRDCPGFLVNRCARPYYLEALRIVEEGAATPAEVDCACEEGGFPVGPFRLIDMIGLDVSLSVSRSIWERSGQKPRWRPSPIQARMVAAGQLGRKSGRGFYSYEEDRSASLAPTPASGAGDGSAATLERIVAQLVNEAWFALDAKIASAADVDLALTVGLGFPKGPLAWGRELGAARIVALLDRLAASSRDPRYEVSPGLRRQDCSQ